MTFERLSLMSYATLWIKMRLRQPSRHRLDKIESSFPSLPKSVDRLAEFIAAGDPEVQVPDQIIKRMGDAVIGAWRAARNSGGDRIGR